MPALKRKRLHGDPKPTEASVSKKAAARSAAAAADPPAAATAASPAVTASTVVAPTRRATRQTAAPLPVLPDPEPRRRRRRGNTNDFIEDVTAPSSRSQYSGPILPSPTGKGKENIPMQSSKQQPYQQQQQHQHQSTPKPKPKPVRMTRHSGGIEQIQQESPQQQPQPNLPLLHPTRSPAALKGARMTGSGNSGNGISKKPMTSVVVPVMTNVEPSRASASTSLTRPSPSGRSTISGAVSTKNGRSTTKETPALVAPHTVGQSKPITLATSISQPQDQQHQPHIASTTSDRPEHRGARTESGDGLPRNVDKVVLGNIIFRTWYRSCYPKELIGDFSANSNTTKGGNGGGTAGVNATGPADLLSLAREDGEGDRGQTGNGHGKGNQDVPNMLERLYVCPCCFKYSKELVAWVGHVRMCEENAIIPGEKIYVHPKGKRTVLVPSGLPPPKASGRGKRAATAPRMVEEVVQDEGEWSIWRVDGEKDILFCQNLSLFAKFFLENKSVYFDVTGFHYFLLVYTPPHSSHGQPNTGNNHTNEDDGVHRKQQQHHPPRGQVVGFFSKEKMSWDNNNLACILVFPPWQRKGLGTLLMGVSYEISKREGVIGGPEKPISDLGKKGYKRFWAGEIARWLLSLETPGSAAETRVSATGSAASKKQKTEANGSDDVNSKSKERQEAEGEEETVVTVEECSKATWIAQEDCLVVLREMGLVEDAGKGPPVRKRRESGANGTGISEEGGAAAEASASASAATLPTTATATEEVQRVRISQRAVREWVEAYGINLEKTCDPAGFVDDFPSGIPSPAAEDTS